MNPSGPRKAENTGAGKVPDVTHSAVAIGAGTTGSGGVGGGGSGFTGLTGFRIRGGRTRFTDNSPWVRIRTLSSLRARLAAFFACLKTLRASLWVVLAARAACAVSAAAARARASLIRIDFKVSSGAGRERLFGFMD